MRALVVGCGSIARRHVSNLLECPEVKTILIYSRIKNCLNFFKKSGKKLIIVKNLQSIEADFALICNETHKHVDTAVTLAKMGIDLFIEKPVSCDLKKLSRLEKIVKDKKIKILVGYNLRFLGAINYIKEQLKNKIIGDLYFAKIEAGQYLPNWRKNIDYRDSYSAIKSKGGGVSLDLSHEMDYMRYFFGEPVSFSFLKTRVSSLKISSDDIFEGIYLFGNNFICNIHLDYLQADKQRRIRIVGSKGELEVDLIKRYIKITKNNRVQTAAVNAGYFDIDKTYKDEISHFIDIVKNNKKPVVTLEDGRKALILLGKKNV